MRLALPAIAAAVAMLFTANARAEEPAPAMPRYVLPGPESARSIPNWSAVGGGLVLFGASYGAALYGANTRDFRNGTEWLAIPVGGPWIALARQADLAPWGLTFDGLAQLGGAGLVTIGFMYPRRVLGPAQGRVRVDHVGVARAQPGKPWAVELGGTF